jgi:hypothetical protein
MLLGMRESYKKGESESILAPSLAVVAGRRQSKRRQGYRWAWVIELRKTLIGALNPISVGEGNTAGRESASDWSALRSLRTQAR